MKNCSLQRRFAAIIYDALLVLALMFLVTFPFIALRGGEPVETSSNFAYQLTLAALIFLFFTVFWSRSGRTLGMQSWGLRLETADGKVPTFGVAVLRFFAAMLSWIPVGLGFVWQLWDKDDLAWHDRLSGTRLVHYPKPGKNRG